MRSLPIRKATIQYRKSTAVLSAIRSLSKSSSYCEITDVMKTVLSDPATRAERVKMLVRKIDSFLNTYEWCTWYHHSQWALVQLCSYLKSGDYDDVLAFLTNRPSAVNLRSFYG